MKKVLTLVVSLAFVTMIFLPISSNAAIQTSPQVPKQGFLQGIVTKFKTTFLSKDKALDAAERAILAKKFEKKISGPESLNSVVEADAGGFLAVGSRTVSNGKVNAAVFKFNKLGEVVWSKSVNLYSSCNNQFFKDVIKSYDDSGKHDGYVMTSTICALEMGDAGLTKIDLNGEIVFNQRYIPNIENSGGNEFEFMDLQRVVGENGKNAGYIVAGSVKDMINAKTVSYGALFRFGNQGSLVWAKRYATVETFQGKDPPVSILYSVKQLPPDSYGSTSFAAVGIFRGETLPNNAFGKSESIMVVRAKDPQGEPIWINEIRELDHKAGMYGSYVKIDAFSIVSHEQGFYIVGSMEKPISTEGAFSPERYGFLMRLDNDGKYKWALGFSPKGEFGWPLGVNLFSIIRLSDGDYAVAGIIEEEDQHDGTVIMKFSNIGELQWAKSVGGVRQTYFSTLTETTDHGLVLVGQNVNSSHALVKLQSDGTCADKCANVKDVQFDKAVYSFNENKLENLIFNDDISLHHLGGMFFNAYDKIEYITTGPVTVSSEDLCK